MSEDKLLQYHATGIAGLLRTHSLSVPFYQRSYSWHSRDDDDQDIDPTNEKLQVEDYWNDLRESFHNRQSYFLGTVVLAGDGEEGRRSVIDGQQRLATTSLLLAAIRDKFQAEGEEEFAKSTQQDFLGKFDRKAGEDRPKLILNSEDRDYYDRAVIHSKKNVVPANFSQTLLRRAYDYLRTHVEHFTASAGTEWRKKLNELVEWLDRDAQIVAIDVATESDAFLIFETLNDRGADLTVADLLKNYLFSQAGNRLDEVRDSWVVTLSNLDLSKVGNQRFTNFARHFLSSKHGRTRERELYQKLKASVKSTAEAVSFSQELKDSSKLYYALLTVDSDYWGDYPESVRSAAEIMVELNLEQQRPLMLAALNCFEKEEVSRLIPAVVSWSIRGLAAGTLGAGSAESAFCDAARDIRLRKVNTVEEILELTRVGDLVSGDGRFEKDFSNWRVTRSFLARYILRALEMSTGGEEEPELVVNSDPEKVNLEHILPKSARRDGWQIGPDEHRLFVHRIGNMCLLQKGPNGRIGNQPWSIKRPILAKSKLHLTAQAAQMDDWSPNEIEARQELLAKLAVATWPRTPRRK